MLPLRPFLRPSRVSSRLCTQCLLRLQSTTSKQPPPPPPTPSHEGEHAQPLYRRLPPNQPAIPSYPTAKTQTPKAKQKVEEDAGFPPALTGFVAGCMIAAGGLFLGYYMSGGARIAKSHQERHGRLASERQRLFGASSALGEAGTDSSASPEEQRRWFEDAAWFYAAYVPGADEYLVQNWDHVVKARATPQGEVAVSEIFKNCAAEIEKLVRGGDMGLFVGKQCWETMLKHIEMVVDVAEESRAVPADIRQKVQKQLDALKKVGSRSGRQERRLLEQRAMEEAKA